MNSFFSSRKSQLQIERYEVYSKLSESISSILPYLKPKILRNHHLSTRLEFKENEKAEMRKLMDLEQWREGRFFEFSGGSQFPISIDNLSHLTSFRVNMQTLANKDLVKIRDILLKSTKIVFGGFYLTHPIRPSDASEIFGPLSSANSIIVKHADPIFKFKISIDKNHFYIEKIPI